MSHVTQITQSQCMFYLAPRILAESEIQLRLLRLRNLYHEEEICWHGRFSLRLLLRPFALGVRGLVTGGEKKAPQIMLLEVDRNH
jgi:hypothetical protein